ncbi:MAG: TonB-dependent receptor [Aestuariibacter sp.]
MNTQLSTLYSAVKAAYLRQVFASALCTASVVSAVSVQAQEATTDADEPVEVIQVEGVRSTIQESIAIKKQSTTIVEGLSASDIGEFPALSIGEALETLTGASSHREQGGATEISIRGLGPYLGSTVFNGREAANGSGDRSVNFSQFPSELFNKIAIYKTQEASFIEGGVSGQILLETLKPLDYGKERFQVEYKGNWNPDNSDLENPGRDLGSRITASLVDQFDFGDFGQLGISIGAQKNLSTNPEQEARTTSSWRDCRNDPNSSSGVYSSGNCDSGSGDLALEVDPDTGVAPDANTPFLLAPSSRSYRQNITDDDRESVFAAIQWQPNDRWEFNLDGQYSDRLFTEVRNDLVFAENRRIDSPEVSADDRLPGNLIVTDSGAVREFTNEQRIETHSQYQERLEEYKGGGFSVSYDVSDVLTLFADLSYSKTERSENIVQTRLQSEPVDIYGNEVPGAANSGRVETRTEIMQNGSLIPIFTVQNFDVTNHDLYADNARTRVDLNQYRNNKITAFRSDFEYLPDLENIQKISGGVRFSTLEFDSVPRVRDQYTFSDSAIADASNACRNNVFPESGFLSSVSGGQNLITNVDQNGNVIDAGTGNAYATFDAICLASALIGTDFDIPEPQDTIGSVDVEEETFAAYIQADYDTMMGDYPVRGNFGVRFVESEVKSKGMRGLLTAVYDDEGGLSDITEDGSALSEVFGGNRYSEWLPSFNLIVEVDEDVLVRGALYRAMSRPDPSDLGFGRSFSGLSNNSGTDALSEAVGLAVATGNPNQQAMMSWNTDFALEWYPNDDTLLAVGLYYKSFQGGFENTSQLETFTVDGQAVNTIVTTRNVSDDTSTIYGMEMTATHSFSYLDGWMSGLGFKVSYNYSDSNFEFEDAQYGASSVIQGGVEVERVGIVAPANLFGFSEHVLASQLYYEIDGFSASLNYKYRSEYFQQFISTPGNLRYIGDTEVFEVKSSYRLNKHLKFSLAAINIFDEPRRQYNPTMDNFAEINVYGPRVFAGVQYTF